MRSVHNDTRFTVGWLVACLLSVSLFLGISATPVLAYLYRAPVAVTENATASYDMLGVMWDQNNTWLADNGFMNSTANDTRVQTLAGLNKPWMVTDNRTLTAIPVPANSQTNLYFATGESEVTDMDIIPGYGGYVTVTDNASIELGDDFTVTQKGCINTDNGTDKNLINKEGAFKTFVSPTVSGNFTSSIETLTSSWTDVGVGIGVNTTAQRIDYHAIRGNGDDRTYYQLSADVSDTEWKMEYTWHPTSEVVDGNIFLFGLWSSTASGFQGYAGDAIGALLNNGSANGIQLLRFDGGGQAVSAAVPYTLGDTYYITLERNTAILATLSIYTDEAKTIHLAGSPKTLAIPATVVGLRYIQGSNYAGVGLTGQDIGWIDNLEIDNLEIDTV